MNRSSRMGGFDDVPRAPSSETRPVWGAVPVAEAVPCVRLFSDDVVIHTTVGLGSEYETQKVPLLTLTFDGDVDPAVEARARRVLESFGAIPLECLDDWAPSVDADYAVRCDGDVHDYCAFSAYVVPQLTVLGWRVEVDPAYEFRVVEREPMWYADVERVSDAGPSGGRPRYGRFSDEESGPSNDWFGLELGVDLDGRRVNLLPALLELLERSSGRGLADLARSARKCVALPIGDGLYLPISAERARAILRVLAELYEGGTPEGRIEFPRTRAAALLALDEVFARDDATITFTGERAARDWASLLVAPERIAPRTPAMIRATLRPYQVEGLAWLQNLRARGVGGVLADDMGLGKTLQTIAHIAAEKEGGRLERPALIVAPTSLVQNWQREIERFAPDLRIVVLHGSDRHSAYDRIGGADVVVTSYPILIRDDERLSSYAFHLVILDEAQTIKNLRSRVHAAARTIRAEHRLCLSGTPVENHLGELWALFDFVNPGLLGDELSFGRFYRVPIEKGRDEERLLSLRALVAPYILRRNKKDVAKELPPKTEVMRPVELRGSQRELYESIRVAAHAEVRRMIRKKGLAAATVPILGALTKLRQVCCDPRLVRIGAASDVRDSAKYAAFTGLLDKELAGGHRVLVFSQFTSMLALIARGLDERKVPYSTLTGATADRAAAVDRFEGGRAEVFLISLKAGGTGLTLTSADVVIHYDPWWNPAVQAQATDRAYRIGQTKPVISYQLFAAGSVEERILGLQRQKRHVADAILGQGSASSALTETDVDVLFAPLGA